MPHHDIAATKHFRRKMKVAFRLSTAFLALTFLSIVFAWLSINLSLVNRRKEALKTFYGNASSYNCLRGTHMYFRPSGSTSLVKTPRAQAPPLMRRLLGDFTAPDLVYAPDKDPDQAELGRIRSLFPEAKIWCWHATPNPPKGTLIITPRHYYML